MIGPTPAPTRRRRPAARQRGIAALLAMMFLAIFGSLAAAMAIVAQGNLHSATAQIKVSRALAAAETGMKFIQYQLNVAAHKVKTTDGVIRGGEGGNAKALWQRTAQKLLDQTSGNLHNLPGHEPYMDGDLLHLGPIPVAPGAPAFQVTLQPHPLPGEDYDSAYYQRPPYSDMSSPVSNANPLDGTYVRVKVTAADGKAGDRVTRVLQMDFKIDKKIRFALLSNSRVMIGRNVSVDGPVGSRFTETNLKDGHPVQMESDFRGLDPQLDHELDMLVGSLHGTGDREANDGSFIGDQNGDNRLNIHDTSEVGNLTHPADYDANGDGYIDGYDFFVNRYSTGGDAKDGPRVTKTDLESGGVSPIKAQQLMELIDWAGDPGRAGYGDGVIDNRDRYAKVHGQVEIAAGYRGWNDGAAHGAYQDYFQGPIKPDHGQAPLSFESEEATAPKFDASDFDVQSFKDQTTNDFYAQATAQAKAADPDDPDAPQYDSKGVHEAVPFGSAYPYDYYDRPVFKNMTFRGVQIPKGTNALFENCKFIGVTFVDTTVDNNDPNYAYAGMQQADGTLKHPGRAAVVDGKVVSDTKSISNNLRFDSCTFEGPVVSTAPRQFTQTRNKLSFTGKTDFDIQGSTELTRKQKREYERSTLMAPNVSVEMGTFVSPADSNETVHLNGTIVAGLIDMRGQIEVDGTVLTTFQPTSGVGPVIGNTSPQFNTTLGYFSAAQGDLEAEIPSNGLGVIHLRYNPDLALPDGILASIQVKPITATYTEGTL